MKSKEGNKVRNFKGATTPKNHNQGENLSIKDKKIVGKDGKYTPGGSNVSHNSNNMTVQEAKNSTMQSRVKN